MKEFRCRFCAQQFRTREHQTCSSSSAAHVHVTQTHFQCSSLLSIQEIKTSNYFKKNSEELLFQSTLFNLCCYVNVITQFARSLRSRMNSMTVFFIRKFCFSLLKPDFQVRLGKEDSQISQISKIISLVEKWPLPYDDTPDKVSSVLVAITHFLSALDGELSHNFSLYYYCFCFKGDNHAFPSNYLSDYDNCNKLKVSILNV